MIDDTFEYNDWTSILVPTVITSAMITAMTANGVAVPEDLTATWNSGTTYSIGQRVHSTSTHRVYESLKDTNLNHDPTVLTNQTTAAGVGTWWLDIGPTNKYAVFDALINTKTEGASPLEITLAPGAFNGFALYGLDADTIAVEALSAPGGDVIYTTDGDIPLEGSMPADFYEYFFDPFKPQTQFIATNIQPYGSSEITLTLKKGTGSPKVGMWAIGDMKPVGMPEKNSSFEPRTYAYIAEDAFGNTVIKKRPNAVNLALQLKVPLEDADDINQTIEDLLGTPVAVVGSQAQYHTKLSTFGLITGRMDYSTYPYRTLSLNVKGFT